MKVIDRCNLTISLSPGRRASPSSSPTTRSRSSPRCPATRGQRRQAARQGRVRRLHPRAAAPERARLRPRARASARPRLQSARAFAAAAAGGARGRLPAQLGERFGIVFNSLFTLANMPIQRFGAILLSQGEFDGYMDSCTHAHRDENLDGVMCRTWSRSTTGLRLRLRLQPDARPAAGARRPRAHTSGRAARRRPRRTIRSSSPATASAAPPARARAAAARWMRRRSEVSRAVGLRPPPP